MQIVTERFGKVLVAHSPDELNEETASSLKRAMEKPLESGQKHVVVQMDRTESFDSGGLTSLLDLQDILRQQGGRMIISGLGDVGRRIFAVTRLDRQFDVHESVIDAVSSLQ